MTDDKQVRIGFILNRGYSLFNPEYKETYGGAQLDMFLLGQACNKRGYAVSFAFLDYGQKDNEVTPEGIRLFRTYPPRRRGQILWQFVGAFIRLWRTAHRMRADVYFLEGANFEVFAIGFYCRLFRKTMIYRIASLIEVDGRYEKDHRLQGKLYMLGRRLAHRIIVQSKEQHDLLLRQGITTTIIPNCYHPTTETATAGGSILWVGRLIAIKRPDRFLDLAEELPDKRFIMVGAIETIDHEYADRILARVKTLPNVNYYPKIDFKTVDGLFLCSSILINSSDYEGFPLTFLQAARVGVPIVSFGVNPDNIVNEMGGVVVDTTAEAVEAVKRLQLHDEWEQKSDMARKIFQKRFSINLVLPKYEALLRSIVH